MPHCEPSWRTTLPLIDEDDRTPNPYLQDLADMLRDGKLTEYWDMPVDWGDSFKNSTIDFIDAIRSDREPVLSGEAGREVLKFALAAIDSSDQKREIQLDQYEDRKPKKKGGLLHIFGRHR